MNRLRRTSLGLLTVILTYAPTAQALATTLVSYGDHWRYLDDGSNQGTAWQATGFNDSAWSSAPAQLGYGDGDEASLVSYGGNTNAKYITTYLRKTFPVTNAAAYVSATLHVILDDGAVVYLNGTEVLRSNMPGGVISHSTQASSSVSGTDEAQPLSASINPALLVEGNNTLAVEVHQSSASSSDISFDLEFTAADTTAQVTRGPYLQSASPASVIVRWRSDNSTNSRVRYGNAPGNLNQIVDDATSTTEHAVTVSGLSADTTYYYSVGTSTATMAGGDNEHRFTTPPSTGTAKPTRIWVLGDSGTGNVNATAVRTAYDLFSTNQATDVWLMLGDNAYNVGTDSEFQAGVFNIYPRYLRQVPLWPTLGNHDAGSASSASQSGPYYDIFTLPSLAQAGGVVSGTEAYYSFDYGNIHFVCLNSQDVDRSATGAMLPWLEDDLMGTNAEWIIAYWHHPPYSKGSHNSDTESQLIEMRENVLPILDNHGVDLVLTGHSHSYERSILLDAHYGLSTTLTGSMIVDGGDGRLDGNGAYTKATLVPAPHQGAVYVVAGSSGQVSSASLNHPVMYVSLLSLGSLVLDVNHNVLQAKFLDSAGTVADHFTMIKGGSYCGNGLREAGEACDQGDVGADSCLSQGCTGGTFACAPDCTFDISGCTACPLETRTPTLTPTRTPTRTPTLTPAPTHDSVVLPLKPLSVTLVSGSDVVKTVSVRVRNADVDESIGHTVQLTVSAGDCPTSVLDGSPDFNPRSPGDQDTQVVASGRGAKAKLRLRFRAIDFHTHNRLAAARCTLWFSANTTVLGNVDPIPSNDMVPLEISVTDRSDSESSATHESFLTSSRPLKIRIADSATSASKHVKVSLGNADILPAAETAHAMSLSINESMGDCPSGSVVIETANPLSASGGETASARITVTAHAADWQAGNGKSPARCTAVLDASTEVAGNSEPDPSNNTTRLVIEVDDRNDY